jgi:hypothetical protein
MKPFRTSILSLLLAAALLMGCQWNNAEKWKVTLGNTDSRPYGAQLAYQSMQDFFGGIPVENVPAKSHYTSLTTKLNHAAPSGNLLVFAGLDFYVSDDEWDEITNFAAQGNEVIIFASKLDTRIEEWTRWEKLRGDELATPYPEEMQLTNRALLELKGDSTRYGYTGRYLQGTFNRYVSENDSTIAASTDTLTDTDSLPDTDTLGFSAGEVNFIRLSTGKGHITLHAAPLVLSNYFLLQDNNIRYLEGIWNTLPEHLNRVYWNSYYKRLPVPPTHRTLWKYPSTRIALLLALLTMAVYIIFQMKRRQRVVPIIPPLKNESVTFVETIGKLYYNKRDHTNLAEKMTQHFLEWVRMRYFINTAYLNDDFIQQLARKSQMEPAATEQLVHMINEIRSGNIQPDDTYLYQLHRCIQNFYKQQQ